MKIDTTIFSMPLALFLSFNCLTPFAKIDIAEQITAKGRKKILFGTIRDNVNSTTAISEKTITVVNGKLVFFIKNPPEHSKILVLACLHIITLFENRQAKVYRTIEHRYLFAAHN